MSASVRREMATGACVGITDIAAVYPLAVLATRRENGMTLAAAVRARSFWAGGYTAGTLLVPYSMAVESLSNEMRRKAVSIGGFHEDDVMGHFAAASGTSVLVTFLGLQPIEKKMTMDQMLESSAQKNGAARRGNPFLQPLVEISAYTKVHGVRALYAGAIPLLLRELCYISSITVANPIATKYLERTSGGGGSIVQGTAAAFSVGPALHTRTLEGLI
ncbi:hypothetical protein T484DRAFT_2992349 [Baffinella frigidus]|nr:hypothetical protein T484DRAFT_2992349 [Cryptophyta sp. CCMP2293]